MGVREDSRSLPNCPKCTAYGTRERAPERLVDVCSVEGKRADVAKVRIDPLVIPVRVHEAQVRGYGLSHRTEEGNRRLKRIPSVIDVGIRIGAKENRPEVSRQDGLEILAEIARVGAGAGSDADIPCQHLHELVANGAIEHGFSVGDLPPPQAFGNVGSTPPELIAT